MRLFLLLLLVLLLPLAGIAGEPAGITEAASGLIWQSQDDGQARAWDDAARHCAALGQGWRLPAVEEWKRALSNPTLAAELGISAEQFYWSATSGIDTRQNPDLVRMLHEYGVGEGFEEKYAWRVSPTGETSAAKHSAYRVRCVR